MPHFLAKDFYSQAISEKATFLSKAILAIPKHLDKHNEDCCFSVNTRYSDNLTRLPEAESSLPSEWEDFTRDIGFLTVETYEEDEAPVIFVDGEGIEVVLSSNPESEGYGSELHPVLELHTNTKPFCEEFTKHSCESAISLEEPMIAEESRDTTSQLVIPASNLVTKFKSLALQDPLRKENGDLWKEEDFFQVIYSNGVYEPPDNQAKAELFCDPEFKKNVTDIGLELLMTPILSKRIPDTFRAEMCEPESIRSLLGISSDQKTLPLHVTMSAVLDNHVEYKKSSCLARLENCESVTDDIDLQRVFHKMSHTDESTQICKGKSTPLLEIKETKVVEYKNDPMKEAIIEEAMSELHLQNTGNVERCVSLLESPHKRSIECNMWLKEKYNDLLCIPEPNVDVPKKPANILQEVIESLNPRADTEISLVPELFTECPPVSIPLLNIDDSVMIYELPSTKPPEEFKKMEHFERECSSPAVEKSDCPPQFESLRRDTQNDTVNLGIQELMKRNFWTQPVDEFNNPLEFFLALRKEAKLKEKALTSPADDNDCKSAIGSEERRNVQPNKKFKHNVGEGFEIRIVPAPFIGPMENILQCVVDCSAPYMAYMKLAQHISPEETFMNISVDSTQFLFKECEKNTQDQQSSDNASLQSALCLNTLRTAADYLVNVDLEVCCVYLVSQADQWKKYLKDSLDVVLEKVCQMQAEVLKNNILHPKLEALWLEVNRFCSRFSGRKLLIVIPRGFPTLLQTVKSMLCKIPQLTVTVLPDFGSEPGQSSCNMACIIQYVESMPAACLSQFSMVIQYDDTIGDFFKTACKKQEHSYIGLVTEVTVTPTNNDPAKLDKYQVPFPLICTAEVSQNKQLLYLLEARYNIEVIERDFSKLQAAGCALSYADVTLSTSHCVVLLSLTEMDQHWDMEKAVKRYLALGLQYTSIFIIAHSIGSSAGYSLGKAVVANLHKLRASLSNLTKSSDYFAAHYKILIRQTEADVAACIRSLSDTLIRSQRESDTGRSWIEADMSKQEEALLQIPCLNPLSAQILLGQMKSVDILDMPFEDLRKAAPELPESIVKYLKHITSEWHHSAQTGSCSSQVSATINLTSRMSCTSSHSALSPSVGHGLLDRNSLQVLSDLCGEKPLEEMKPFHYNISPVSATHSGQSLHLKKAEEPKSVLPIEIGKLVSSRPHSVAEDSSKSTNLSQNDHNKDIQFTHSHLSQHSYLPNFLMHSEKRQDPAADAACIIADCRENSSTLRTSLGERVEKSQIDRQISSASELQIDSHSSLHNCAKPVEHREIQKAPCVQPQNNHISQCVIPESEDMHWRQFQSLPNSAGLPHPKLYSNIFCGQNRDFNKQGACCTVDALCEPELSDDLRRDCYLPRNLHPSVDHSIFHLEDGDLQDQVRDHWMPQSQCFLNNCGHVINSGKDSEEPVNDVLQSEPHGFSLLSNCDEDQNADAVFNNDEEFRVSGLLISPTHPHFQKPSSSSFCIKEEEANVKDSSWSKGATSQFLFGGMNERGSTDFSCRESSHSSYGIFSSTVSRQTPSIMTPSPETINLNIPSNACPTSASTRSEKGYAKSLFDLLGQKQDGDTFDSGISPLPFTVSKALKKHMNQAEEQSTFRAPSMFLIAQVGHASRGNRITRQAKFTFNHNEMSSQQEPTDCTADLMKAYHSNNYRLREEPTSYFPPLLHKSKNPAKDQSNQASVQATNTNSLREDDSVPSIFCRGEEEQCYPACYDMVQPGKPEHFENISTSSRHPSYLKRNHKRDKSPQLLRPLKYRPVGTKGLEQTVCEPLGQLETVSEDISSSNNTCINGQTQSGMFFGNNQYSGVWGSSPTHITNHSKEHLVRGWNEPGSLSAASQLSNNHQATYSCDEFVKPSANVAYDTMEIVTSPVQRENGRPTFRIDFPANSDSRLPLSDDFSAAAPSIQQRQHSSRWKKFVSADETDKCLLPSNCQIKVQWAPPLKQYSKQYSGEVSAVSVAGLTYNHQDSSSPPMDFSGSDDTHFSLKGSRTALDDSKLNKWREYFLGQTFANKGDILCRHEQATYETSADSLHRDQGPKRKEPQL